MSEITDKNFHEETFEAVEDTQEVGTQETDTSETDSNTEASEQVSTDTEETQKVETQETDTLETDPEDNWQVRARYQQSEASKFQNEATRLQEENLKLQEELRPKPVEDVVPQRPNTDDPDDLLKYNAEVNEYLLKQNQIQTQERKVEKQQTTDNQIRAANDKHVLDGLTTVTKNAEKSQRMMHFYNDAQNMANPALIEVMYDAAMGFNKGQKTPSGLTPAPPPPTDGGQAITEKKTPDDEFDDEMGKQQKDYRL